MPTNRVLPKSRRIKMIMHSDINCIVVGTYDDYTYARVDRPTRPFVFYYPTGSSCKRLQYLADKYPTTHWVHHHGNVALTIHNFPKPKG